MMKKGLKYRLVEILLLIFTFIYISPLVLTVNNSFKKPQEFAKPFFVLPERLSFQNYIQTYELTHMGTALINSVIVTAISIAGIVFLASMAAYGIARRESRYNKVLYTLFVSGLVLPFPVIMVPVMKLVGIFGLRDRIGLIVLYFALGMSFAIFLFTGFIRSTVPIELEESVIIDGATAFGAYRHIVIPLIKPIIVTVVMMDTIWLWNDFLLPSLMLTSLSSFTIPLSQFKLVGEYQQRWNLQFASFTIAMVPLLVLFFSCQKYFVKGITAGAVKG